MNLKTLVTFIVVTLGVLLGVGGMLWQFGKNADKPIADVAGSARHQLGTGEIEVVEFSDLQCPACQSIQAPLKEILAKYEGKVKFVYRHFPLVSIHKNAQLASLVAESSHLQGKFFEMHDLLFARQNEWANLDDPKPKFVSYASELGLDIAKFEVDLNSAEVKEAVNVDVLDSTRFRLTGTPSFFVNGRKVEFGQLELKIAELVK